MTQSTRYGLNGTVLRRILNQRGEGSLLQFCQTHHLNRATLHKYLRGEGPLARPFYQIAQALGMDPLKLLTPVDSSFVEGVEEIMPLALSLVDGQKSIAMGLLGSRARGKAKRHSDWDLGVTGGKESLKTDLFLSLKQQVDDLAEDLPHQVDFINLDQAPLWFLREFDYEPVFLAGSEVSWGYFLGRLHATRQAA